MIKGALGLRAGLNAPIARQINDALGLGGRRPKFTQAQRAEILSMLAAGRPTDAHATRATPVTSAQVWKARVRAARYWAAGT